MILATLIGAALSRWAGLRWALPVGLVLGMIVVQFLPGKSCALPPAPKPPVPFEGGEVK